MPSDSPPPGPDQSRDWVFAIGALSLATVIVLLGAAVFYFSPPAELTIAELNDEEAVIIVEELHHGSDRIEHIIVPAEPVRDAHDCTKVEDGACYLDSEGDAVIVDVSDDAEFDITIVYADGSEEILASYPEDADWVRTSQE